MSTIIDLKFFLPCGAQYYKLRNYLTTKNLQDLTEVNYAQVIQFLNTTHLPDDPMNAEVYERRYLTTGDILSMLWKYTDLFDKNSVVAFGKWCTDRVDFTAAHPKRKRNDSGKVSVRSLFVAKDQYLDDIAKKIVNYLPHYQLFIQNLKDEGYNIVGYARKSRSTENDDETRTRLLQQMARRLKERSLADKIFVSPRANADELMTERDLVKDEAFLKQLNVDGDAQVILGYAGLSTNCNDLETCLRNNKNISKIIVDHLPFDNTVKILDSCDLLQNPEKLKAFNCRTGTYQRSK